MRIRGILLAVLTAGAIVTLGLWTWSLNRALEDARRAQAHMQGELQRRWLNPNLRLRAVERRLDWIEQSLLSTPSTARIPEVIALRRWTRTLEAMTQANGRRLDMVDRVLDSLQSRGASADSMAALDPG